MEDFQEKIGKIIAEDLPSQVGEQLKKRLELIETLEGNLKHECEQSSKAENAYNSIKNDYDILLATISEHEALDVRLKEIENREREAYVMELTVRLEEADKRADLAVQFTQGLIRNTEFRTSIMKNSVIPGHYDVNGNFNSDRTDTHSTDTIQTAE